MGLTNTDWDKLNQDQQQDVVTAKDFDNAGEFELLPEGHYLVEIDDLKVEEYQGTIKDSGKPYACNQLIIDVKVIEPVKYAGKRIRWNRFNMFSKGEPEWAKNKRLAFLTSTGLVKKGDAAAVAAFRWQTLVQPKPMRFVFELEHVVQKGGKNDGKLTQQGKGFCGGFKAASLWGSPAAPVAGTTTAAGGSATKQQSAATNNMQAKPQQQTISADDI